MKKAISILIVFVLSFFTINPLPPVFAASFPGTVTGSTGSLEGERKVSVTNAPNQATLKLYTSSGGAAIQTATISGSTFTFSVKDFGKYYVTSTTIDGEKNDIVSDPSPIIEVKPGPVTISQQDSGTDQILVTNAVKDAELILYNDRTGYVPQTTIADNNGRGVFTQVPPGLNYKAKQKISGVEGPLSTETINILPKIVQVTSSVTAGPTNNQGTITILESTPGNTIRLYDANKKLIDSKITNAQGGYVFTGLQAGTYHITQLQNGAESREVVVKIGDAEIPLITLNGDREVTIIVGNNYSDAGASFTDNIDSPRTLTGVHTITTNSEPGIYYVTFNAIDSNNNPAMEVKRKVTILPQKVNLTPVNTNEATGDTITNGPNGQIKVQNVYSGSILYLYQDPNGKMIRTITDASSPSYTINDVPVGKDYYVIQEYTNKNGSFVQSEPSTRIEIKDTTKPVLSLLGNDTINLEMNDRYTEYGATASDNVDSSDELNSTILITHKLNTNLPGSYTITYNVKDKAGNSATPITRVVNVSPLSVIAIGSTADLGEVGVKNAISGAVLNLYRSEDIHMTKSLASYVLETSETTHLFTKIAPGSYFVTQTANNFTSKPSNVVDVIDIDRPYITLEGPEKLTFVLGQSKEFFDGSTNIFTDPGATAYDYLDGNLTSYITKVITPSIESGRITEPGSYTITYSVTAKLPRHSKADDKFRTITVAPPKTTTPTSTFGKGEISAGGLFLHTTSQIRLYNTYGQLMETKSANGSYTITFENVPAGLGYYVTQIVNGIESAPSEPVNVNIFEEAKDSALIASFEFPAVYSTGIIDQKTGVITVTVPKDTDITNLKASFTSLGSVKVGTSVQSSGVTSQNFTNQVVYTVLSNDGKTTKTYYVNVEKAKFITNTWTTSVNKKLTLTNSTSSVVALNPSEKMLAEHKGISFISTDRAIHVPAANVLETSNASLTASAPASFTKYTDPEWRKSIEKVTEVKWGNTSFMQPLEIEMLNPENKAFAKLTRVDGKLYAQIQPSEKSGTNIVGLAAKSGTYALVENIAKPTIFPSTINGETTYRLYSSVSGGQIYYTTSSANINFDRSSRNNSLNSYSMDNAASDLSDWTLYNNGDKISASSGELYAFVIKDQMISPLNSNITKTPVEWKKDIPTYSTSHVLKITFNTKVEKKVLYSGAVYVIDNTTGKKIETKLSLSPDNKTILVAPITAYTRGHQYTLTIEREFKGNTLKNEFLKQPLTRTFTVK